MRRISVMGCILFYFSCRFVTGDANSHPDNKESLDSSSVELSNYFSMANSYFDSKQYDSAIKYLNYSIKIDSLDGKFFFMRGKSYSYLFDNKSAISDYLQSAKLNYRTSDAYFNVAVNSMFDNDSMALYYFKKSSDLNPNDPDAKFQIEECAKRLLAKKAPITPIKRK